MQSRGPHLNYAVCLQKSARRPPPIPAPGQPLPLSMARAPPWSAPLGTLGARPSLLAPAPVAPGPSPAPAQVSGGISYVWEGGHAASRTYLYVLSSPPFPFKALILTWVLLCACRNLHGARRLYLHWVSHFSCRWHVHRRGLHHGLHRQPVRPFLHQPQRCLGLHWHLCR